MIPTITATLTWLREERGRIEVAIAALVKACTHGRVRVMLLEVVVASWTDGVRDLRGFEA